MNTEQHIHEFLARGGSITRCPTVYGVAIPGAEPIRSGVSDRIDPDSIPLKDRAKSGARDRMAKARAAKARTGPSSRERQALAEGRERCIARAKAEDARLLAMLERGESLEFIAKDRGCNIKRIKIILRRAGFEGEFARSSDVKPRSHNGKSWSHEDVLKAHSEGLTNQEISDRVGPNVKTVREILKKYKLKRNTKPKPRPSYSDEFMRQVADYYVLGHGTNAIRAKFGCSQHTTMKALDMFGIERRPPGVYAPKTDTRQGGNRRGKEK